MNWPLERFDDKDIVFVGAGQGRAMAGVRNFLEKHAAIRSFSGVDKQSNDQPLAFLNDYPTAETVFIKNEGIPGRELPVPYVTPMQLFFELVPVSGATVIGITGTKGKSTTAALTADILKATGRPVILAGNIGVSPLPALNDATSDTIFVLELSSYQLSDLTTSPHISACVNLFNDHTNWHGSLDEYWEAKHNIMRFARTDDTFIYNPSFPALVDWAAAASCQTIAINPDAPLDMAGAELFGEHNRLNALVAREISRQFGVSDKDFLAAMDAFTPLRHRMQFVADKNNVIYIDDAIGMTPESTLASLAAVSERYGPVGCLLLGGQNRSYNFTTLLRRLADEAVPALVLFPDTTEIIKAGLPDGYTPKLFETSDMTAAVDFASRNAADGSVVLLSTAAPSYSVWRDFEDKGDQFQSAVAAL